MVAVDVFGGLDWGVHQAKVKTRQELFIDTLGACNLKCPSCPTGRREEIVFSTKILTGERLRRILAKATAEARVTRVNLFNWTDSLLHPEIADLVAVVQDEFGLKCRLSSNLNHTSGLAELVHCPPLEMIVSLSGFTQQVYEQTHAGGDIERVKDNMEWLSNQIRWDGWRTKVTVAWHRYRSNVHEEPMMRRYVKRLGFTFAPVNAVLMPLEAVVDGADLPIIKNLLISPKQGIAAGKWWYRPTCPNRDHHIVLDSMGQTTLCCPTFDAKRFGVGNFLELSLSTIQKNKDEHPFCAKCQNTGVLAYYQGCWPIRRAAKKGLL